MSLRQQFARLPAYALNGVLVALGAGLIRLLIGLAAGPLAAQLALSGALATSLADVPTTPARCWRRLFVAATLSFCAALVVTLLRGHPVALGFGIAALSFASLLMYAWGSRANALSFAPMLALIFAMAAPERPDAPLQVAAWNGIGALAYLGWGALVSRVMQRRYRTLVLADALAATAGLLRTRARLLEATRTIDRERGALQDWIAAESTLGEALQQARDFVYVGPPGPEYLRNTAVLVSAFDVRDLLLASGLDLELLGNDASGNALRKQIAAALCAIAADLQGAADAVHQDAIQLLPPPAPQDHAPAFAAIALPAEDLRARLVGVLKHRLDGLAAETAQLIGLIRGTTAPRVTLDAGQLRRFVAPESWRLADLRAQLHWHSPVLRHALRSATAVATAYFLARMLPWASHPHWLVLSVAVVLRGNLEQTLARRNMRVTGTLLGCGLVVLLMGIRSGWLIQAAFLLAVGTGHAFATRRYWLTAAAATVMALLQAHLINPPGGFPIFERAADTLLGALLAWAFSYVLPSWERRQLPRAMRRLLLALERYAAHTLHLQAERSDLEQRLARRRAYDTLSDLAALLHRSAVEPRGVQLPRDQLGALLDRAQRLMAHLSMVRLTLMRNRGQLETPAVAQALQQARAGLERALHPMPIDATTPAAAPEPPPELPEEQPGADITPWLLRRLQLLVREGRLIRAAADALATDPAR